MIELSGPVREDEIGIFLDSGSANPKTSNHNKFRLIMNFFDFFGLGLGKKEYQFFFDSSIPYFICAFFELVLIIDFLTILYPYEVWSHFFAFMKIRF